MAPGISILYPAQRLRWEGRPKGKASCDSALIVLAQCHAVRIVSAPGVSWGYDLYRDLSFQLMRVRMSHRRNNKWKPGRPCAAWRRVAGTVAAQPVKYASAHGCMTNTILLGYLFEGNINADKIWYFFLHATVSMICGAGSGWLKRSVRKLATRAWVASR
jgi:hypothetical protein